jgi:hypothetical protein
MAGASLDSHLFVVMTKLARAAGVLKNCSPLFTRKLLNRQGILSAHAGSLHKTNVLRGPAADLAARGAGEVSP